MGTFALKSIGKIGFSIGNSTFRSNQRIRSSLPPGDRKNDFLSVSRSRFSILNSFSKAKSVAEIDFPCHVSKFSLSQPGAFSAGITI